MIENDKIITLANNQKYAILDNFIFEDTKYYIGSLYEDKITNSIVLLKEKIDGDKVLIKIVDNQDEIIKAIHYYKKEGNK